MKSLDSILKSFNKTVDNLQKLYNHNMGEIEYIEKDIDNKVIVLKDKELENERIAKITENILKIIEV